MKIVCVGAGPAGLYFAICMKLQNSSHEIMVIDRNAADCVSGWGIILPDKIVEQMKKNDIESATTIQDILFRWDNLSVSFKNTSFCLSGHPFAAIGRLKLLSILQNRAKELGITLHFNQEFGPANLPFSAPDLIIGCDGANSKVRQYFSSKLGVEIARGKNKYRWFGTTQQFKQAFSFIFKETKHGWVWAHCYQFDSSFSTFIVECHENTWNNLGLDSAREEESLTLCEEIFSEDLNDHRLMNNMHQSQSESWLNFPLIKCRKWFHENIVLMGDAAHTKHFSIGSGTRLAIEDAIDLATILGSTSSIEDALKSYQMQRQRELDRLDNASINSMQWFEELEHHGHLEPIPFTYSLLTRSGLVSHESIRMRDKAWLESAEKWFSENATRIV